MIKETKDKKFVRELKGILNGSVRAGAVGKRNANLLGIHEFGASIKVTPKQRAFLHYLGIHLKGSTTQINIPARKPLRTTFVGQRLKKMNDTVIESLGGFIDGKFKARQVKDQMALAGAGLARENIRTGVKPKPKPITLMLRKQSKEAQALIDTGRLEGSLEGQFVK